MLTGDIGVGSWPTRRRKDRSGREQVMYEVTVSIVKRRFIGTPHELTVIDYLITRNMNTSNGFCYNFESPLYARVILGT